MRLRSRAALGAFFLGDGMATEQIEVATRLAMYTPCYSLREAAEFLGVSYGTLRNWRVVSRGPQSVVVGGRPKFRYVDLERWVRANTEEQA